MKGFTIILFFLVTISTYSQEWIIVDILEQSKKELVYKVDNGVEVKRETVKSPSIVKLINDYQAEGFRLKSVTQGVELELNGNFPMNNNWNNNFGITNLNLSNNNRIMLWFEKRED
jgi:ABC-type antimicrobial peptide transport system permease subunit